MRCPMCDVPMREVNRRGVLIDVCPECKGLWLDRGELEKLMAVADEEEFEFERRVATERRRAPDEDPRRYFGSSGDSYFGSSGDRVRFRSEEEAMRYYGHPKKKSWFTRMMDAVGD